MGKHEILIAIIAYLKKTFLFVFVTVGSFMAPINPLILGVIILTGLDLSTGVRAARKRGEEINSTGFYRTVVKFKDYILLIVASHLLAVIFFPDMKIDFAKLAAGYIAYIEFRSFCENMKTITDNPVWDKIVQIIPDINVLKKKKNGKSRR